MYFAKATHATVVDAETRQPIASAVVVASWVLYGKGGGDRVETLKVTEVLTDREGHFTVPGWGPKIRPGFAELTDHDPEMIIFKSSYEPKYLTNKVTSHPSQAWVRVSEWDGKTIVLKPFRGTPRERLDQLDSALWGPRDASTSTPNLYTELLREREFVGRIGDGFFGNVERLLKDGR
jgi:hypothetical protein